MKKLLISVACATLPFVATSALAQPENSRTFTDHALDPGFDRFVPDEATASNTAIDYTFWHEALGYMVLRMGVSTRQGAGRPPPSLGTNLVYGHDSRIRMEGNRVAFDFLDQETIAPLSEYRADLERIGSEIDISSLPRNEQLAYWLNLHNVAVIEQIALNYPVTSPSKVLLGGDKIPLDSAPFITVAGVKMSPRDIRTKIVYPNWHDPKVIYGFFRGDIGGPSIQREAFNGDNVDQVLRYAADEFVNSLRGVEAYGDNLLVSRIYEEAAPYYFPQMADDLRTHLRSLATPEVAELIARKQGIKVNQYYDTIADLAAGEREPTYHTIISNDQVASTRVSSSVARLLKERYDKYETLRKQGRVGRVIVLPPTGAEEAPDTETE